MVDVLEDDNVAEKRCSGGERKFIYYWMVDAWQKKCNSE